MSVIPRPMPGVAEAPPPADAAPQPVLGPWHAIAIAVGTVVGVGIFKTPALVAANAGSPGTFLLAWLLGGVVSLAGALCYAELAAAYPHAGGDYHYLTRAFGRRVGFLFAWARLGIIQTGSIALLAFVLGDYASQLLALGPYSSAVYAALVIVALTALHAGGVPRGVRAQSVLTTVEVLGVLVIVGVGLTSAARATAGAAGTSDGAASGSLGLAMVFVLLTYGGWNEVAYVSAEVRDPGRNMARALIASIVIVTGLYLLVNWAYLRGLGLAAMGASEAPAADLVARSLGAGAAGLISALVVISALTSVNATIFTGARTAYALGREFRPFAPLGRWHTVRRTPANALVAQGLVALALVLLGVLTRKGFQTMVEYTAPVFWAFFLLTGVTLLVLRRREPDAPRPFRVPLYPFTPLLFCGSCAYLLYASLAYTGVGALVGVGVLVVGIVLLFVMDRADTRSAAGGGH